MGDPGLVYALTLASWNHRGPENTAEKHDSRLTSSVTDPHWRQGVWRVVCVCVCVEKSQEWDSHPRKTSK